MSPLLSNVLLTPFDREMRSRGYQLTRYADDWVHHLHVRRTGASGAGDGESSPEQLGVNQSAENADRACPAWI